MSPRHNRPRSGTSKPSTADRRDDEPGHGTDWSGRRTGGARSGWSARSAARPASRTAARAATRRSSRGCRTSWPGSGWDTSTTGATGTRPAGTRGTAGVPGSSAPATRHVTERAAAAAPPRRRPRGLPPSSAPPGAAAVPAAAAPCTPGLRRRPSRRRRRPAACTPRRLRNAAGRAGARARLLAPGHTSRWLSSAYAAPSATTVTPASRASRGQPVALWSSGDIGMR